MDIFHGQPSSFPLRLLMAVGLVDGSRDVTSGWRLRSVRDVKDWDAQMAVLWTRQVVVFD